MGRAKYRQQRAVQWLQRISPGLRSSRETAGLGIGFFLSERGAWHRWVFWNQKRGMKTGQLIGNSTRIRSVNGNLSRGNDTTVTPEWTAEIETVWDAAEMTSVRFLLDRRNRADLFFLNSPRLSLEGLDLNLHFFSRWGQRPADGRFRACCCAQFYLAGNFRRIFGCTFSARF